MHSMTPKIDHLHASISAKRQITIITLKQQKSEQDDFYALIE